MNLEEIKDEMANEIIADDTFAVGKKDTEKGKTAQFQPMADEDDMGEAQWPIDEDLGIPDQNQEIMQEPEK